MKPQRTQRLWLAPSSPVENQTVSFEYFVKGFALFALDSPQTIENPVPRDHHDSYSILSRKAHLSGGKGLSLLVEPTTCGLAVLTIQNMLPHPTLPGTCFLYRPPTANTTITCLQASHSRTGLLGPAETVWSKAVGICLRWVGAWGVWDKTPDHTS